MFGEDDELKEGIEKGTRIKVIKSVKVFHAPKIPELDLEGWEGEIQEVVKMYKGALLSATLPYKVQFELPNPEGTKAKKFVAHLAPSELEAV